MKCILKVTKDCRTCASQWDQGRGRETGETGCQNWGTLPRKPVAAVTEHRYRGSDVQREVQKPQKIKKDVRYVMRGTWREKKAPCIIQRKWQLWDDSESGTGEMLGVRIQFPQNHPLSAFYHSPTMSREKSHCCNSVKQMLWNCTLTVQTYTGAKKKNGYRDFPECRKDRLTSLQHLPSLPILIFTGWPSSWLLFLYSNSINKT